MKRLQDKVAIVTGAAHGLGLATMRLFVEEGAKVVAVDIDQEMLQQRVSSLGTHALAVSCDITDADSVQQMINRTLERYQQIDALVHYAGITRDGMHWKMNLQAWSDVIRVNLTGTFLVAQAAAKVMRTQQTGSIVLTASRSYLGNIGQANYSASKGGVVSLTRTMALELGRYNVRVNALSPGFIETRMTRAVPDKIREKAIRATPLQRTGQPEEVAKVALFLASNEASFMTGQVLAIDGGRTVGTASA